MRRKRYGGDSAPSQFFQSRCFYLALATAMRQGRERDNNKEAEKKARKVRRHGTVARPSSFFFLQRSEIALCC